MRWNPLAGLLPVCLAVLAACDDSTGLDLDPRLVTDTVLIGVPTLPANADLPTALDITGDGFGGVEGGRFPELPVDAGEWDFILLLEDGQLVLAPARVLGLDSRAGITEALSGETFEGLREVPGQSSLITDRAVPLREGAVYAARSRETSGGFFGICTQFAKLTPLDLDLAQGRASILITTNEQCSDPRLVPE